MVVDGIDVDIDVQASPAMEGTERLIERGRGDVGYVGTPKTSVGTKAEAMKGQRASMTIRVISEGADIEATLEESRARRTRAAGSVTGSGIAASLIASSIILSSIASSPQG